MASKILLFLNIFVASANSVEVLKTNVTQTEAHLTLSCPDNFDRSQWMELKLNYNEGGYITVEKRYNFENGVQVSNDRFVQLYVQIWQKGLLHKLLLQLWQMSIGLYYVGIKGCSLIRCLH